MPGKETRQLIRVLERQGFTVRLAKSGHYRATGPGGDTVTLPATPRQGNRSYANQRARLRAIGADL
jgi:predicted RNA binding protein YcfA (HicA-like mRNA interferase family)